MQVIVFSKHLGRSYKTKWYSLTVYDYVKTAAKKTPGLKTLAEQLGERFKAIRTKFPKAASGSSTAERLVNEYYNLANESLTLMH